MNKKKIKQELHRLTSKLRSLRGLPLTDKIWTQRIDLHRCISNLLRKL